MNYYDGLLTFFHLNGVFQSLTYFVQCVNGGLLIGDSFFDLPHQIYLKLTPILKLKAKKIYKGPDTVPS